MRLGEPVTVCKLYISLHLLFHYSFRLRRAREDPGRELARMIEHDLGASGTELVAERSVSGEHTDGSCAGRNGGEYVIGRVPDHHALFHPEIGKASASGTGMRGSG
jgi:hypothetical protein